MARMKPGRKKEPTQKRGIAWPRWTGFRGMTVRDWLQLLIVPLALVVIGFLFTMQQDARQQAIEVQRAERERAVEEQRAQDEALQAYLDQMSTLLMEQNLRGSNEDSEVRTLARARTLTVLGRLDPKRKTAVMQFLGDAQLLQRVEGREAVISLAGVDLTETDLRAAQLSGAVLHGADLSSADLSSADLPEADLRDAGLSAADLSDAHLSGADLNGADLSFADLRFAKGWIYANPSSLLGATMTNAQKEKLRRYQEEKREDRENIGPS